MASEFVRRVRHVEDINTFSKWGLEEGDLVLTNDNKMYALIGQEWKQLDNMEKVWATSEAGKYLMVGDDGIVKPMVIDDIRKGDNNWEGENNFEKNGVKGHLKTRELLEYGVKTFSDISTKLTQFQGLWRGGYDSQTDAPEVGWYIANIISWSNDSQLGYIILHYTDHSAVWFGLVSDGKIDWHKNATSDMVVNQLIPTAPKFTNINEVATDTYKYSGIYYNYNQDVKGLPDDSSWGCIEVKGGSDKGNGVIEYHDYAGQKSYIGYINNFSIVSFKRVTTTAL